MTAEKNYLKKHGFEAFSPKAVLFDMDGVLFDSMPLHARCWSQICSEYGLEMNAEDTYLHEGRTGEATIDILVQRQWGRNATAQEMEEIYEGKCRLFNACEEAPKMPGAESLLSQVKAAELTIVVVTGSGQQSLLERLHKHFSGFFHSELIVSSADVCHGKPDPEPYLMGLRKAGVHPWEAVVVENAPLGVQSAVSAGAFTIAVNTGPLPASSLLEAGADMLFPSMQALSDQFPSLLSKWLR